MNHNINDLPDETAIEALEWLTDPAKVVLACGCVEPIAPGDVLYVTPSGDGFAPIAIDRVTIH
jgi:hypothetical protein